MTATLIRGPQHSTLRFERHLHHAPERVWRAITDPAELREWFPADVIYEPREGAPMQFDFGGVHGQDVWPGEVVAFEPPRVFAFRWGTDELRFDLHPGIEGDPAGTTLVFNHTFVHEPGKPARDAAGWESCFESFDALLDSRPGIDREDMSRWAHHHEAYLAKYGDLTVEADGDRRRVRLQGPPRDLDGRSAIDVTLGEEAQAGVLVVRDAGAALAGGAAVEVLTGSVAEPGRIVFAGVLRDPLARDEPS